jgi:homoserine dehydrogenase
MSRAPLRIAVLGAGTVGLEVIRAFEAFPERLASADGAPLSLVGVAVRDLDRARARGVPAELLTDAPAHLVASSEVDAIVELMGGDEPARTLTAAALGAGKPVVTANKHVVAHHGPALEAIARRTGAAFRFEASVAGGTPVLGPLAVELAADRIGSVRGIVNGTTNSILTAMASHGRAYGEALADAQAAGYAEADPGGDVDGDDAVNKLVVLARLAFGAWLDPVFIGRRPPTVSGEGRPGISGVATEELKAAAALGLTLKLLARASRLEDGSIAASVLPTALPAESPLGRTSGVENRIEIDGEPVGRVSFGGPGAGGSATSSAVLGDLIALARPGAGSTWAGLPAASETAVQAADPGAGGTPDGGTALRRFFASTLPDQLVRDQVEIEAARGGGFIAAARPLAELRAGLVAAGVEATLYAIDR